MEAQPGGSGDSDVVVNPESRYVGKLPSSKMESVLFSGGYFARLEGSAKCNICQVIIKRTGGSTTGCIKHLQNKHKDKFTEFSRKKEQNNQEKAEERANEPGTKFKRNRENFIRNQATSLTGLF